jgi:NAD(P)H-hydrate epimerase
MMVRRATMPKTLQLAELIKSLPSRKKDANKRDFGSVLVFAGDEGMPGAARICAEASIRVGAGLVILATHPSHSASATVARPEIICHGLSNTLQLSPILNHSTVMAIGPGLTQSAWSQEFTKFLLGHTLPTVIDAGALDIIKPMTGSHSNWIITPHPGEAARLLDTTATAIQQDRVKAIQTLQQRYGCVVVLKGAGSLIHDGKAIYRCEQGNPGMASAGMGDLLTGIIAGLIAQGLPLSDAAKLGVCLHAAAGDLAAHTEGQRGLLALDLLPFVRKLLN